MSGKATGPPLADPSGRRGGPEVPSYLVVVLHQHRMPPPITHTSRDLRCHRCCGLPCTARRRTREKQVRVPLISLPGCREGMLLRETVCVPFSWHSHHGKPSPPSHPLHRRLQPERWQDPQKANKKKSPESEKAGPSQPPLPIPRICACLVFTSWCKSSHEYTGALNFFIVIFRFI